jgi:hypothetical protein
MDGVILDEEKQVIPNINWENSDGVLTWTCDNTKPDMQTLVSSLKDQLGLDLTAENLTTLEGQLRDLKDGESYNGSLDIGTEEISEEGNETQENEEELFSESPNEEEEATIVEEDPHIKVDVQEDGSVVWEADETISSYKQVTKHIQEFTGLKLTDVGAHAVQNVFSVIESNPDLPKTGVIAKNYIKPWQVT